jgi:hypothetical protein
VGQRGGLPAAAARSTYSAVSSTGGDGGAYLSGRRLYRRRRRGSPGRVGDEVDFDQVPLQARVVRRLDAAARCLLRGAIERRWAARVNLCTQPLHAQNQSKHLRRIYKEEEQKELKVKTTKSFIRDSTIWVWAIKWDRQSLVRWPRCRRRVPIQFEPVSGQSPPPRSPDLVRTLWRAACTLMRKLIGIGEASFSFGRRT